MHGFERKIIAFFNDCEREVPMTNTTDFAGHSNQLQMMAGTRRFPSQKVFVRLSGPSRGSISRAGWWQAPESSMDRMAVMAAVRYGYMQRPSIRMNRRNILRIIANPAIESQHLHRTVTFYRELGTIGV